jgi:hypothetical protein
MSTDLVAYGLTESRFDMPPSVAAPTTRNEESVAPTTSVAIRRASSSFSGIRASSVSGNVSFHFWCNLRAALPKFYNFSAETDLYPSILLVPSGQFRARPEKERLTVPSLPA